MEQQTISQRLAASLSILSLKNAGQVKKITTSVQGSFPYGLLGIAIAVVSLSTSLYSQIEMKQMIQSYFLSVAYVLCAQTTFFWSGRRAEALSVLHDMVETSRDIESMSSKKQLSRMASTTKMSRMVTMISYGSEVFIVISYVVPYIIFRNLPAPVPVVVDDPVWYPTTFAIEVSYTATAPNVVLSFLTYQFETCLCLARLFEILSEHIENAPKSFLATRLIRNHTRLLDVSTRLRKLWSHTCFIIILCFLSFLVINTYDFINGSNDPRTLVVLPVVVGFVYGLCSLGELVSESTGLVHDAVYRCDWINADTTFRMMVLQILMRSQRKTYLKAGMIGNLGMAKFSSVIQTWYKFVQALQKLS